MDSQAACRRLFSSRKRPVAEYWLACLEELGINETVHAQLLAAAAVNTIFRISPSESSVFFTR